MRWDILNAALAPSLYFAQGLFCRCARGAWCFTYTISYGQTCLGSGRGATKGCNLCLDCGFCQVHLGFSIFHLGSCPIYLIFFLASLKIAERKKKITLSGALDTTSPVSYCHVQVLRKCWACLMHKNKIFLYHQQCRCFIHMVTVPVRVSHSCYVQNSPCRMNAEYIIEICSAGEWFPSADPGGKSSLTHRVRDVQATQCCMCVPALPIQMGYLPLRLHCSSCGLLSLYCWLWLCPLWQSGARRCVFSLKMRFGRLDVEFQRLAPLLCLLLCGLSKKLSAPR